MKHRYWIYKRMENQRDQTSRDQCVESASLTSLFSWYLVSIAIVVMLVLWVFYGQSFVGY